MCTMHADATQPLTTAVEPDYTDHHMSEERIIYRKLTETLVKYEASAVGDCFLP